MSAGPNSPLEGHLKRRRRNLELLRFIHFHETLIPDWRRMSRLAIKAGFFSPNSRQSCFLTLERLWRKRRFWYSEESRCRYPHGAKVTGADEEPESNWVI